MRESKIEHALVVAARKFGGDAYKWMSPARRGVPDRIVILPGGVICFVEVKAPGRRPSPLQSFELGALATLGCNVAVVDSVAAVAKLFAGIRPC